MSTSGIVCKTEIGLAIESLRELLKQSQYDSSIVEVAENHLAIVNYSIICI